MRASRQNYTHKMKSQKFSLYLTKRFEGKKKKTLIHETPFLLLFILFGYAFKHLTHNKFYSQMHSKTVDG